MCHIADLRKTISTAVETQRHKHYINVKVSKATGTLGRRWCSILMHTHQCQEQGLQSEQVQAAGLKPSFSFSWYTAQCYWYSQNSLKNKTGKISGQQCATKIRYTNMVLQYLHWKGRYFRRHWDIWIFDYSHLTNLFFEVLFFCKSRIFLGQQIKLTVSVNNAHCLGNS